MLGYFQAEKATEEWLKANDDILKKYPLGAALIAPRSEEPIFNRTSYNYLRRTGLQPRKRVGDYLREVAMSEGVVASQVFDNYTDMRRQEIMNRNLSPQALKTELDRFDLEVRRNKENLYRKYDGLKYKVTGRDSGGLSPAQIADSYENAIREYLPRTSGAERERLETMMTLIDRYREAKSVKEYGNFGDPNYDVMMSNLRAGWTNVALTTAQGYPDDQFVLLVKTLTAALDMNIEELQLL
jgi:hypothetical protein